MGRTTVEQSKEKYVVMNRLTYPEAINERELNAIAGGLMESLIPVTAEKNKKGIAIKCSVAGMTSLQSFFRGVVSKKMFLNIIVQIISIVKECERNLLNTNNLMLDCEYIFLDSRTKQIKCIFWPIVNNQNTIVMAEFFHDLPFHAVFSKLEEHDYISSYLNYFKSNGPFSINSFEKMIFELMGKTVDAHSRVPFGSTGPGEGMRVSNQVEEVKGNTGNIAYNPFRQREADPLPKQQKSKFCSKCGSLCVETAKFCSNCGSPLHGFEQDIPKSEDIPDAIEKTETQTFSETTVLGAEDLGGTTVLGAEEFEEPTFPYLVRESTQEEISINKPCFRIGKERRYCDYFISNNNAVSRSHADILTKDNRYYIVDNNSTNKTYVDDRAIPVQKEVEIFSGTRLRLANENFVFYI